MYIVPPSIHSPSPPLNAVVVDWRSGPETGAVTQLSAPPVIFRRKQLTRREVAAAGGDEVVQPAGRVVLGEVDVSGERVFDGAMVERAQRGSHDTLAGGQRTASETLPLEPFSSQENHPPAAVVPPVQLAARARENPVARRRRCRLRRTSARWHHHRRSPPPSWTRTPSRPRPRGSRRRRRVPGATGSRCPTPSSPTWPAAGWRSLRAAGSRWGRR